MGRGYITQVCLEENFVVSDTFQNDCLKNNKVFFFISSAGVYRIQDTFGGYTAQDSKSLMWIKVSSYCLCIIYI